MSVSRSIGAGIVTAVLGPLVGALLVWSGIALTTILVQGSPGFLILAAMLRHGLPVGYLLGLPPGLLVAAYFGSKSWRGDCIEPRDALLAGTAAGAICGLAIGAVLYAGTAGLPLFAGVMTFASAVSALLCRLVLGAVGLD